MRRRWLIILILTGMSLSLGEAASAASRFPPPDFESGHRLPETTYPAARATSWEVVDVGVLILALSVAAWLALKRRSRRGLFLLSIFSLVYFGFYRGGCVCPIGAIQDVALALGDSRYALPVTVIAFFLLPLLFALIFGRVFCAGVCPLGAMQDLVLIRPVRIPQWLRNALGVLPLVYLGAAVLFAVMDSMFIICRYDPFIAFFRLGGHFHMLVFGGLVLLLSTFVGRPYCGFACPYRVLLGVCSRVSWRHATITPDECIVCSLCEDSCPFGAIRRPTPDGASGEKGTVRKLLMIALPLVVLGGFGGYWAGPLLARTHRTTQLAGRIAKEDPENLAERTLESAAFRETGRPTEELFAEANEIERRFRYGGLFFGAFCGMAIGLKLLFQGRIPREKFYNVDREGCVSCGRCFMSCPQERLRLKTLAES